MYSQRKMAGALVWWHGQEGFSIIIFVEEEKVTRHEVVYHENETLKDKLRKEFKIESSDYYMLNEQGKLVAANSEVGTRRTWMVVKKRDYTRVFCDGTSFLCLPKPWHTVKRMLDDNGLLKKNARIEDENGEDVDLTSEVRDRRRFSILNL